jgi:deoxyribodipyrimidine photo-lyase
MPSTAIVWYRRDLRVHDHPALAAAVAEHDRVVPLFVLDPRLLHGRYASQRRIGYMRSALHALDAELQERGSRLHVREGDPLEIIPALADEVGAQTVFWTSDVSPFARERDAAMTAALGGRGGRGGRAVRDGAGGSGSRGGTGDTATGRARPMPGNDVVDVSRIATQAGDPYTVFSPFHRTWQQAPRRPLHPAPTSIPTPTTLDKGRLEPGTHDDSAGEAHGRAAVDRWLRGPADAYAEGHDDLTGGTSQLSPHLRWGTVSPLALERRAADAGHDAFTRQLAWRDFYAHVLLNEIGSKRPDPSWDDDPGDELLDAWRAGQTGYPLVDAGMRQLNETGWMHNRARLVVGSFLTKDLHLDWRLGEVHFARELIDGELAQNNGNWRWIASVGVDPAPPARRMFNPTLQQRTFDPDGVYVRRWVPELARVPDDKLAEPWTLTDDEQRAAGCVIGRDYPAPIVDHAVERRRAIELYARSSATRSCWAPR